MSKYATFFNLKTQEGLRKFLTALPKLYQLRTYTSDMELSEFLLDFEFACKQALNDRQFEVLRLVFIDDMRQVDAAERLGITQQTVQIHLKVAMKKLVKYFNESED